MFQFVFVSDFTLLCFFLLSTFENVINKFWHFLLQKEKMIQKWSSHKNYTWMVKMSSHNMNFKHN